MAKAERKIVHIDPEKCNGCGICVDSCHEGAIAMVDGKARLVSDSYCDGLGDCLAPCPTGAITLTTRPADDFNPDAVEERRKMLASENAVAAKADAEGPLPCGCPGMAAKVLHKPEPAPARPVRPLQPEALACGCPGQNSRELKARPAVSACDCGCEGPEAGAGVQSQLMNWPVQLKLVPVNAPYLKGADILLAADCAAAAAPDFHQRFLRGRPLLLACPKLDENEPQIEKLAALFAASRPASVTVLRMEVPCCGGLVRVAREALDRSGVSAPLEVAVLSAEGEVVAKGR